MIERPACRRLENQVAIVTGSSRGIGKAIALGYAREGARVVLVGRDMDTLAPVVEEIRLLGAEALPVRADVSQPDDVEALLAATVETFGRVDVLVNNAGVSLQAPAENLALRDWQRLVDTNISGVFLCSQAAGREMLRHGSGCIVNIASMASFVGYSRRVAYASTKSAVLGLTRVLAVEWGRRGIRVNAIAPGHIMTDLLRRGIERQLLDPEDILRRTPLGRLGDVEDVVGPAVFLASDEANFITGQTLVVDGGWLVCAYME